jgi:chemotaxis protein methyltransferase CheR
MNAPRREDGTKLFREAIGRRTGLYFDDGKLPFLDAVLERRLAATGVPLDSYLASLSIPFESRNELLELAKELTVGETYFFRHTAQFQAFQRVIEERLSAKPEPRHFRVLSAGCASGEEAYSLAILLRERSLMGTALQYEVHACDLNPVVLARAAHGRYSVWSLRETGEERRRRWFSRNGSDYVLDQSIREAVTFTPCNLAEDLPGTFLPGTFDIVFCRNVLMYFTPEIARRAVLGLARLLTPHGHLFLGHAENLRGLSHDFHLRYFEEAFYYQRKEFLTGDVRAPGPHAKLTSDGEYSGRFGSLPPNDPPPLSWMEAVQRASERVKTLTESSTNRARTTNEPFHDEMPDQQSLGASPSSSPNLRAGFGAAIRLLEQERFADALQSLADSAAPGSDPDVLLLRAALLTQQGALDEAARVARMLLELDELSAGAHYLLALCCEGGGSNDGAIEHYRMATHLDATFAMSHLHLGLLARRAGDRDTAESELRAARELLLLEDPSRLLLFGGGFRREGLVALCNAELQRLGAQR